MNKQIRYSRKNYTWEFDGEELIITNKLKPTSVIRKTITEDELKSTDMTFSNIISCVISDGEKKISTGKKKYTQILIDIYKSMSAQNILLNTTFKFKLTDEKGEKGYNWYSDINMSFQSKDAKGSLKEILSLSHVNKYSIEIYIKLATGKLLFFKI